MSLAGESGARTPDLSVLLTTTEDEDQAGRLAEGLLEAGLAACVQLSRIDSLYLWQGAVQRDPEVRVMIKTRATLRQAATDWLLAHHPYDVPQVVALDASAVAEGYQDWLEEVTRSR